MRTFGGAAGRKGRRNDWKATALAVTHGKKNKIVSRPSDIPEHADTPPAMPIKLYRVSCVSFEPSPVRAVVRSNSQSNDRVRYDTIAALLLTRTGIDYDHAVSTGLKKKTGMPVRRSGVSRHRILPLHPACPSPTRHGSGSAQVILSLSKTVFFCTDTVTDTRKGKK